jgi:hypothetical protein
VNSTPAKVLLPLALAALAAACTPANTRPGATIPTAIKAGQSWVVTRPVIAAQVLDTCSRPSPGQVPGRVTGYWAPSRAGIEQLESHLPSLAEQIPKVLDFNRQYVGIEMDGRRLIYVNAFTLPDHTEIDPSREAIRVCDGGAGFWGAVFDPESGVFSDVQFNGSL